MKVKRGDIVYIANANMEEKHGSIQGGNRPYLVVSNDIGNYHSNIALVVPLTSRAKKLLPTHLLIHYNKSTALCEQIKTISQEDITTVVDSLLPAEQNQIDCCLKISLNL